MKYRYLPTTDSAPLSPRSPLALPTLHLTAIMLLTHASAGIAAEVAAGAVPGHPATHSYHTSHNHKASRLLEEVIVSVSPIHNQHSDNARPVSVLNGDQLRRNAAATLADTLTGQVGVSSASFGPGVGNPVIRGQSANRVKVMQDNLDTLDASNTSADHANTTEPLLAEQIEILRGPSTLRFGSGAIGGVVNVIDGRIPTRQADGVSGAVETRFSSANQESANVFRIDGGAGAFAWHADGLYRDGNDVDIAGDSNRFHPEEGGQGYIPNSSSRANAWTLGGSWVGERGFVGVSVNRQQNQYGIPAGAHSHAGHDDEHDDHDDHDHDHHGRDHEDHDHSADTRVRVDMEQTRYDLKGELHQPLPGFSSLLLRMAYNDYQHTELENGVAGTRFDSQAWESRIELVHNPVAGWEGAVGVQYTDRNYGAAGAEAFIPRDTEIQNLGVFWIEEKHWDRHWVELGLRHERQTVAPDDGRGTLEHSASSGSLGYHWSPAEDHQFSVLYSLAERAPSMEELLSDGAHIATQTFDLGNPHLDNEVSRNLDLGYEWQPLEPGLIDSFKLNLFYNRISDFIYQHNTGMEDHDSHLPVFRYQQQDARFHGSEIEATLRLTDSLNLRLFGDAVRAKFASGGDVPRLPPHRVGAELQLQQSGWYGSLQVIEAAAQNRAGDGEERTNGYTRVDAQVSVPLVFGADGSLVFVRATNLLDEDIRQSSSLLREVAPEAGRGISAGVRLVF